MILKGVSISLRIPVESSPLDSFWAPKLIVIVLKNDIYIYSYLFMGKFNFFISMIDG